MLAERRRHTPILGAAGIGSVRRLSRGFRRESCRFDLEISESEFAGSPSRTGPPFRLVQAARVKIYFEIKDDEGRPGRTTLISFSD